MAIDKAEIEYRFKRSIGSYDENAYAQKAIIRRLMELLKAYPVTPAKILEIGCGTGLLTQYIRREFAGSDLFINDLVGEMCSKTASRCGLLPGHCVVGDIEQVALEGKFDLILSASTFQWLATPAMTFARLAAHLREGGWLVFSTFGKENYKELKKVTGTGLVYHSIPEISSLLFSHFQIIHTEESKKVLEFNDPLEILQHIKKTGVNATDMQHSWTRGKLQEFSRKYAGLFEQHGKYPLTYHPQYFICKKTEGVIIDN